MLLPGSHIGGRRGIVYHIGRRRGIVYHTKPLLASKGSCIGTHPYHGRTLIRDTVSGDM